MGVEINDCLRVRRVEEADTCNTPLVFADDFYPFVRRGITPRRRIPFTMLRGRGEKFSREEGVPWEKEKK